jgi:hypothetical protein
MQTTDPFLTFLTQRPIAIESSAKYFACQPVLASAKILPRKMFRKCGNYFLPLKEWDNFIVAIIYCPILGVVYGTEKTLSFIKIFKLLKFFSLTSNPQKNVSGLHVM